MRLTPLPEEEWDDHVRSAFAGMLPRARQNLEGAGNALGTLANHPDLTKSFLAFSTHLLFRNTLPGRLRELIILRVAKRRNCEYEWAHHVTLAADEGLTESEIQAAGRGEAAVEPDSTVLRAVEELEVDSIIAEDTWAALGEFLDKRQCMDLVFTVGGYAQMAMAFNTFGVTPEHNHDERTVDRASFS